MKSGQRGLDTGSLYSESILFPSERAVCLSRGDFLTFRQGGTSLNKSGVMSLDYRDLGLWVEVMEALVLAFERINT